MQPNKIESTMQYNKFVLKPGNRPVRNRVASLITAMHDHNQLQEYPILVSEVNGHFEIADGQHRFEAAKALKVPVFYIRSRQPLTIEQIAAANALQKSWTLYDWLDSWIGRNSGGEEYRKLKHFCETFQVPITVGMELLGNPWGGEQRAAFKAGKFKCCDLRFAQTVGHVLGALRGHIPVADLRLVRAIIKVLRLPGISIDRLIKKIAAHSSMFERQSTWLKYVEMLEIIYNKKVHLGERLSIAFEVDKMERKRRSETATRGNKAKKERKERNGEL